MTPLLIVNTYYFGNYSEFALYSEVLKAIASIENGLAKEMQSESELKGGQLTSQELDEIISDLEKNPYLEPRKWRILQFG